MGETERLRQRLQFAMAVRDADGADVIALDEQQLQRHQSVMGELVRVGDDRHAARDRRRAGRQQAANAGDLDQTQSARPGGTHPFHMAEGGDVSSIRVGHLEYGLAFGERCTVRRRCGPRFAETRTLLLTDGRWRCAGFADIAPQAAAASSRASSGGNADTASPKRLGADRRWKELRVVAGAWARLRRRLVVLESRHEAVEARFAVEIKLDIPRRFLAVAHRDGDVGRPADEVAAGEELSRGWSPACSDRPRASPLLP